MRLTNREKIVIYGCGINGIRLYYALKNKMDILYFVDKNSEKHGYVMEKKYCISYDDFLKKDKNINVIVSPQYPEKIAEDLKKRGFFNVYTSNDFLDIEQERAKNISVEEILRKKILLENGLLGKDIVYGDTDSDIKRIIEDYKVRKANEHSSDKLR